MSASPSNASLGLADAVTSPTISRTQVNLAGQEALQALLAFSSLQEQIRQRRARESRNGMASDADVWELEEFVLDEVLQLVAERARAITGADGVAIALAEGDEIICRASAGDITPDAGVRNHGLTLAPEVARNDMREQIRKPIRNEDLYEGCREAFKNGWRSVKLYFMCGLPGERVVDLDGIVDMSETIARIGKEVRGRHAEVTASVSNFVPKPHTPYQWNPMQTREYFQWAGRHMKSRCRIRAVRVKQHDIERSLLEGLLTRGDRRIAPVIEEAWRRGARLDAWDECFNAQIWWDVVRDLGVDLSFYIHRERPVGEVLPWDHVNVKKGREWLEKDHGRSLQQLEVMRNAVEDLPSPKFVVRP